MRRRPPFCDCSASAPSRRPHYHLKHLALLDERVRAHLQALRVAGPTGLQLARRQLGEIDGGSLFVAAWLAFDLVDREAMSDAEAKRRASGTGGGLEVWSSTPGHRA